MTIDFGDLDNACAKAENGDNGSETNSNGKNGDKQQKPNQATRITELVMEAGAKLFYDDAFECFARVPVNGHVETNRIRSKSFQRILTRNYYESDSCAPSSEGINAAINLLEAHAQSFGQKREVSVRVAGHDGKVYVDLGDPDWTIIEISSGGWETCEDPPVLLHRPQGVKELPHPSTAGSLDELRKYLNTDDEGFLLTASFMVGALHPKGPYPVLCFLGEQGTGKSSASRLVRSVIDPNVSPLRATQRNEHDLIIAATNGWIVGLDNISATPQWLSDGICRLSTGGGFSARRMYTDSDEQLFSARRPVIINGIDSVVTRHDLADRTLFVTLKPIPQDQRITEREMDAEYENDAPIILGGLFDAVSTALRNQDVTHMDTLPRMADFALWIVSAEPALPWDAGRFMKAYGGNRRAAIAAALDHSELASALISWFSDKGADWTGSMAELKVALDAMVDEKTLRAKAWPKTASVLSRRITELSAFLRESGIDIEKDAAHRPNGTRLHRIRRC